MVAGHCGHLGLWGDVTARSVSVGSMCFVLVFSDLLRASRIRRHFFMAAAASRCSTRLWVSFGQLQWSSFVHGFAVDDGPAAERFASGLLGSSRGRVGVRSSRGPGDSQRTARGQPEDVRRKGRGWQKTEQRIAHNMTKRHKTPTFDHLHYYYSVSFCF
ncbi:hypothetical protein PM082_024329 [Marasmius tenuissimus]|nr:hypothetical protein PM082_024329 [Marasmius tenuissimus]